MSDPEASLRHVKLVATNDNFTGAKLWIDGKEPAYVHSIDVRVGTGEVNQVTIVFSPDELDVEIDEGVGVVGRQSPANLGKPTA